MQVRAATQSDVAAVTGIYAAAVHSSWATFDTVPPGESHWSGVVTDGGVLVAERDGTVLGYAKHGTYRPRPAYAPTVEVSVYVDETHRGQRVGDSLYAALLAALDSRADVHLAVAGIALPNPVSLALHRRHGFVEVGVFHEMGRKFDRWHDVAWYERRTGAG